MHMTPAPDLADADNAVRTSDLRDQQSRHEPPGPPVAPHARTLATLCSRRLALSSAPTAAVLFSPTPRSILSSFVSRSPFCTILRLSDIDTEVMQNDARVSAANKMWYCTR